MSWFDFWLAFALAGALILAPGLALLTPLRLAWGQRLVFAPVASAAAVAVLGIAYGIVGIDFTPLTFVAGTAALAVGAEVLRRVWLHRWLPAEQTRWSRGEWIALGSGLVVAFGSWLIQFVHNLGTPSAVAKTYDLPWHLSIIRQILDTGNASTLKVGYVVPTDGPGFYPASFHGLVAMVARGAGTDIPTAINATILAIVAIAWPLSMVALTRTILRTGATTVVATVVMTAGFAVFPMRFTTYGVLYANLYGYALLPALIAAAVLFFRTETTMLSRLLLLGVTGVGAAVAQPNSVFTVWLLLMPFVIGLVWRWAARRGYGRGRQLGLSGGFIVVAGLLWVGIETTSFMHRTVSVDWAPWLSLWTATKDVFIEALISPAAYFTAAFVLAGAVIAWFKARWLLGAHALACACFVINASTFFSHHHLALFRKAATGYWYHDSFRLAATIILTSIPLAVLAIVCLSDLLAAKVKRVPNTALVAGVLAVAVLAGAMAGPAIARESQGLEKASIMHAAGEPTPGQPGMINSDKVAFMAEVKAKVGDALVANDPDDGSVFGYGLVGLNTYFKAYIGNWMGTTSGDQHNVMDSLRDLSVNPAVCDTVQRTGIKYVLLMGRTGRQLGHNLDTRMTGHRAPYSGLEITPKIPGFTLVLQKPAAGQPLYWLFAIDPKVCPV